MLAFGAMAVPLARLTFAKPYAAAPVARAKVAPHLIPTLLRLRYAHPPKSLSLRLGGRELLSSSTPAASPVEVSLDLDIPRDGVEFALTGAWDESTADTAVTLEIEPEALDLKTETRWSPGASRTEVISFQWK